MFVKPVDSISKKLQLTLSTQYFGHATTLRDVTDPDWLGRAVGMDTPSVLIVHVDSAAFANRTEGIAPIAEEWDVPLVLLHHAGDHLPRGLVDERANIYAAQYVKPKRDIREALYSPLFKVISQVNYKRAAASGQWDEAGKQRGRRALEDILACVEFRVDRPPISVEEWIQGGSKPYQLPLADL